jgi:hypothetical protein
MNIRHQLLLIQGKNRIIAALNGLMMPEGSLRERHSKIPGYLVQLEK